MSRRSVQRALLVPAVPLSAIAAYLLIFNLVPGFEAYTWDGLRKLGLYDRPARPRAREIIRSSAGPRLWAGARDADHFDISTFRLEPGRLRYGLGRERFPALITPEFATVAEVESASGGAAVAFSLTDGSGAAGAAPGPSARWPGALARVLVVKVADDVRVYPLHLLRRHEVVNDVVGGRPIFVAYCYLADLAAAYDRRLGAHALTFAVSGYTYHDPDVWDGRDAFILWDRDTESLWWPPLGKAVSGPLVDAPMRVLDEAHWAQTTWGEARARFPEARVLREGQRFTPPEDWPRLEVPPPEADAGTAVAPQWGGNPDL